MDIRTYLLGFLLILFSALNAQQTFKVGEIIDEVPVINSSETFSLYLPTSYNQSDLSAIVFIFDPSGNAHNGVKTFLEAAEKFDYILVCSNATRNGIPYETNFASINVLFKTIFPNFRIDEKQIYAAGFSGGSRLASSVATLTNKFQAVIACGAGMAVNNTYNPKEHLFSFIGMVGNRDMNYQEMLNTKQTLDTLGVTNELLVYDDTHRWPPKKQIQRAFEWIELRAYEKKIRKPNDLTIDLLYNKQYRLADSLLGNNRWVRAIWEFKHLQASFRPFKNLDSIQEKIQNIEASTPYKKALLRHRELLEMENTLSERFLTAFQRDLFLGNSKDNFSWWKKELKQLNQVILLTDIKEKKIVYERVKFLLQGGLYESSFSYASSKDYKRALYCDQLLAFLLPDHAYVHYRLAVSYARNDQFSNAMKYLKKAKELKLHEFSNTKDDLEFAKYRTRKKFLKLYK